MNKMKNVGRIVMLALVLVFSLNAQAQSKKTEKKILKCYRIFENKDMDKGLEKLKKYMDKEPWPASLIWYESLVDMERAKYYSNIQSFSGLQVMVEGNSDEENDSLSTVYEDMLLEGSKTRFINVCRRSTIEATSYTADMYLRRILVDFDPDTLVSEKAKNYFSEGEEYFGKEDYKTAEMNYRKAVKEDTTYYAAYLYLGDSFWAREQYDSALVYFTKARDIQPELLEARLYIADALIELGLFYRAKKECIDAMMVYPGYNLKIKLQRILEVENKYLHERRILRGFYPNDMDNDEQYSMENNPIWSDYRAAKDDVSKYCDLDGIIEENGEFEDRYLEVYSYRKMLEAHPNDLPEFLHFADKMREEGYLECYIFTSLFHIDIYPQFKDYMSSEENREKTREFIEKYVIEPIPSR